MKKNVLKLLIIGFTISLQAQETIATSGGEATGNGTASYTVGQVVYTTNTETNGSVAQGVQQAYEISIVLGENETNIDLQLTIYPNPTTNYITLKVTDKSNLSYMLYDLLGKIIKSEKIDTSTTSIYLKDLASTTYFLKVVKNNKEIKTFKIIKN